MSFQDCISDHVMRFFSCSIFLDNCPCLCVFQIAASMDYGLHKDYVYVDSVPVNMYTETELGALSRFALREHAEKVTRLLKGRHSLPYGEAGCDLASWISNVQRISLEPLRNLSHRPNPSPSLLAPRLRRSKSVSTDPRLSPRGPLVQLEHGLIASSDPCVFSDGQRLITPPFYDDAFAAEAISHRRMADDLDRRRMADDLDRRLNRGAFGDRYSHFAFDDYAHARAAVDPLSRLDVPVEARIAGRLGLDSSIPHGAVPLRAWESATPWRSAIESPGHLSRFSLKSEFELRAMNLAAQREHSMRLYQKLGGDRVGLQIPGVGEDLAGWCLGAQRLHAVDPVAEIAAVDKLDDAVGTKRYTDAHGHRVTTHTRVDASGWEVRTTDVDGSLGSIARTLTPRGGKNSPIKRTVYDPYVEGFKSKTWQDRLEGLTAGGPGLWGVRRSSMLDDPAWSADLGPRSPINMNDALWKKSVRAVI